VHAALQDSNLLSAPVPEQETPGMPGRRRLRKTIDLAVGKAARIGQFVNDRTQAGTEDQCNVASPIGSAFDACDGFRNG
jgi:hypothetical protein